MSDIIRDKIEYNSTSSYKTLSFKNLADIDKEILVPIGSWKGKLNKAIHIDTHSFESENSPPGSIFIIEKDDGDIMFLPDTMNNKSEMNSFKRKHFLQFLNEEKQKREDICNSVKIICIDMTPPCDHANKKAEWNKYMIGILLPIEHEKYCCLLSKNKTTGVRERYEGKLLGDNLVKLPTVYLTLPTTSGEFRIIFNSRLTISLPSNSAVDILGSEKIGRIREQLLSDIRSWFIRQTTRPGIIELR